MTQMFWRFHNFLPFYRVGHNYYLLFVFLFIYSSFPRPSRDHYERLCRVSIPFLRYWFLFCFACSFFIPKREQPSLLLCVFFCSKPLSKKDTTSVSIPLIRVGHNFFDISFYNSFFSSSICVALILVKAKSRLPASFNDAPMR